jgi:hypothetical protein
LLFALAPSVEEARRMLLKDCPHIPTGDIDKEPRCIEKPEAFVLCGGG